ncbi:nuclear transport factor 2 family protein [Streptomyces bambusae]|uniref:nuclear transport factor 2 family protein n=1 Tax=Streptomyces bambusae TaxID=1550616 RepID=UPI001CFEFFC0|nr:nuclear transport factor 2 family protein [Streptomyces bambusae]MCB5165722.1 nuclear transport factor 2 family protein [Streptomyces bambusae]
MTATYAAEAIPQPRHGREFGLLYAEVQQFYSRQMQLFDSFRADDWAATFTESAVFDVPTLPAPVVGRPGLAANVRRNRELHAAGGEQMRHWLGMLDIVELPDGSLSTRSYAIVYLTPRGGEPRVFRVCVMEDIVQRTPDGWQVSYRLVTRDDLA